MAPSNQDFFMAIQSGFLNNLEGWSIHFQRAILMVIGMEMLMVLGMFSNNFWDGHFRGSNHRDSNMR